MRSLLLITLIFLPPQMLQGQGPAALPSVAERVSSHIVTVRVRHKVFAKKDKVTVCTGVAVGKSLVVTACYAARTDTIRLTIPGGRQAKASLRVIDDYSGLALLSTQADSEAALEPIKLAQESPRLGSRVVSAAGWGLEQPVVTFGAVSGTGRRLQNTSYPPLLQCDVRTTKASAGAALTNRLGELVGIVTLVEREKDRQGFTYGIPVSHVRRILNVARDKKELVVVQRRRPVVGMTLAGGLDDIKVSQLVAQGPAEKAGLKRGDLVLAVDGIKVRSVYQAVQPVMYKQPGDKVRYLVKRDEQPVQVDVKLGGGAILPNATLEQLSRFVSPKIRITGFAKPPEAPTPRVENLSLDEKDTNATVYASPADKIKLLEKALDRYRRVILHQQGQLSRQQEERRKLERRLVEMEREIAKIRRSR